MRKSLLFAITIVLFASSCSDDDSQQISEETLRGELGLGTQKLSSKEIKEIKNSTEPIYFESLDEAKKFFNKEVTFSKSSFYKNFPKPTEKSPNTYPLIIKEGSNILKMTCPPTILDPVEGCDDNQGGDGTGNNGGGCGCGGAGTASFTAVQNGFTNYNVDVTYNTNTGNVEVSSDIGGMTLGISWTEIASSTYGSYNCSTQTVNFQATGYLNYNIVFEGIGTVYRQRTTIRGSFRPCAGSGGTGGIEEFLQPANQSNN